MTQLLAASAVPIVGANLTSGAPIGGAAHLASGYDNTRFLPLASLRLASPLALRYGLERVGILWNPARLANIATKVAGIYCWVGDTRNPVPDDELHRPVLYIGRSSDDLKGRLTKEQSLGGGTHGHGRMVARGGAVPIGGPVQWSSSARADAAQWLDPLIYWAHTSGYYDNNITHAQRKIDEIHSWLFGPAGQTPVTGALLVDAAERICIRLAIALGDVDAPVNSQNAGAWANYHASDWVAWAIAYDWQAQHAKERQQTQA